MDNHNIQMEVSDKLSLRGRVFSHLREEILSGKYQTNDELKEMVIANELGVSRTPVREAFRQLELEGLIHVIPNKGAYVNGITAKDIRDIYAVRSMLEGLAARWATEASDSALIKKLEDINDLSEFHMKRGNMEQVFILDNEFHDALYEASRSKILNKVLSDLHEYVQRIRRITLATVRANESIKEHRDIVKAIKDNDPEMAEKLADIHIVNSINNISNTGVNDK